MSGRVTRDGVSLAYRHRPGRGPTVVFLPGFGSDMAGEKATRLDAVCAAHDRAFLRFDYAGHGESGGAFADGTIGGWTDDTLAVIDHAAPGPIVLVGSSMGGWIALLAALARADRVAGLLGIAAAPDFTEALVWNQLSPDDRARMLSDGLLRVPSAYGGEQILTRRLIEEGRDHLLLDAPIAISCPVRLIHGRQDPDVPWDTSLRLADCLASDDVRLILVKDAGHRLSRPADLALIETTLLSLLDQDGGQPLAV